MDLNRFIELFNSATPEQCARAMEKLPTGALEWAVRFEALAQAGRLPGAEQTR